MLACGAKMRPMASSPRTVTQTGAVRRRSSKREAHRAVHRPSACSGVKALRNTSDAKAASRQAPLAFRSLDPFRALRELDRRRRDEERPFPLRTKNRLTGKAPYKSCANLIPRSGRRITRVSGLRSRRGRQRAAGPANSAPTRSNISVGPYSSTAFRRCGRHKSLD
jgi:hypothetical protein